MSEYYLPVILLVLSFGIKLLVNREIKKPNLLNALSELPVDVMFIGSTLIISYIKLYTNKILETLASSEAIRVAQMKSVDLNSGLTLFITYILITLIVTAIWRLSEKFFIDQKWVKFVLSLMINYIISSTALYCSISLLNEVICGGH